ncbi:MAG TPA: SDR family oxidoreductase [Ilumatobacter sp.]|nr:SDR family oxidoreductase [Ilumatobacter sp.]
MGSESEFAGRIVLVTGSSSGIGERIAERFAELGATVVVNSASSVAAGEEVAARLHDRYGTPAIYLRADISDADQARGLVADTVDRYGGLDVLVNNAGWTTRLDHRDLDALTDDIFRRTFDVNVWGTWALTKAAIPHLRESADGNVVTITSVAGLRPIGSSIAYAMSKAALNHMTVLLAKSYGPVRFNAVAPGLVETPWTADWDDMHAGTAAVTPLGRSATPDDCAEAVLALVRNRYTTGEVFVVDGGITLVM